MPKKSCSTCTDFSYTSKDHSCWDCSSGGPGDGWAYTDDPDPKEVWCSDWRSEKKQGAMDRLANKYNHLRRALWMVGQQIELGKPRNLEYAQKVVSDHLEGWRP